MTGYIFSDNQEDNEYYRLRLLEEAFDKKTKTILHHAGLKEGWKCLEIGPGAGSIFNIDKIDSEMHLEFGGSAVAKVMSASTEALKEKYTETGECSEDDIGTDIKLKVRKTRDHLQHTMQRHQSLGLKPEYCMKIREKFE